MLESADKHSRLTRWWYYKMARLYYDAVRRFGRPAFKYRKPDAVVTLDLLRSEYFVETGRKGPLEQSLKK